jgi:hypothetical protein
MKVTVTGIKLMKLNSDNNSNPRILLVDDEADITFSFSIGLEGTCTS